MQLRLIAIYLNNSQLDYIIALNSNFLQDKFNFNFEYYDSQSEFAKLHDVKTFPTFFLLKNNLIADTIYGKLDYSKLKERILTHPYANNS